MNKDTKEGTWKQIEGEFKEKLGKLSNDDSTENEGKKEKLMGEIQEKYGKTKDEIAEKIKSW